MRRTAVIIPLLFWACSEDPVVQPCRDVPDGGCPLSYGKACDDPACSAAYACDPGGVWRLDHVCAPHDAGPDAPKPPVDAGARDVDIDVPGAFGGPGCAPLQTPDCPLGTALVCPNGACCDCTDLFVCRNGGWDPWGTCDDGGIAPLNADP
ncbi:MAG TPA: hypothetical protein VF316_23330 [Polyangiaceae bacterium]